MRILVIDDQTINQKLLHAFLKGYGLIESTNTAKEGLAMFINAHIQKEPFEIIFIDIEMPNMNGYELGSAIRTWEMDRSQTKATLVFNSALSEEENRDKLLDSGCDQYIRKPLTVREVRGYMDSLLLK